MFFSFCILVDMPMGGYSPPLVTLLLEAKDRNAGGQGHSRKCSKKKKSSKKFFRQSPISLVFNIVVRYWCKRKTLKRNWNWRNNRLFAHWWNFNWGEARLAKPMLQFRKTKKVFANFPLGFWRFPTKFQRFKKWCCPRAEDRAIFVDLRLRGLGLEASRPRTSKRVLEDSTSGVNY